MLERGQVMDLSVTDVLAGHGMAALPKVTVDSYNLDVRDGREILNHKLRKARFFELLDEQRERLILCRDDPMGSEKSSHIGRSGIDDMLRSGSRATKRLLTETIDIFAGDMADVLGQFLATKQWKGVERIAVGFGNARDHINDQ